MRKLLVVLVAALLVPGLALAKGKPTDPGKSGTAGSNATKPMVMYVLRGTLTAYTAPSGSTNGTVTITVKGANHHGASLVGRDLTFAVSSSTRIVGTFTANDNGLVKVRGPKAGLGDPAGFGNLVAKQVIDQGSTSDQD